MKRSGIYEIKNKVNNNIYIGSAISLSDRKNLHFSQLKRGIHHSIILQKAYNKYGKNSLIFKILEYCNIENLIEKEQYYIDTLRPIYNICKIAGSTIGRTSVRRKPIIQYDLEGNQLEIYSCLQDIMKKFNLSNSSRIIKVCKGIRNKAYGFVWRYFGEDHIPFSYNVQRKGKPIAEINENGEIIQVWERVLDCAKELNTKSSTLCNILSPNSRYKTLNGKLFKKITNEEFNKYNKFN